jgi:transposase-like protein
VVALVERGGRARAEAVDNVTSATLRSVLRRNASTESVLMTDEWQAYRRPGREFARHETVNHSHEEYVRGEAHTNTIEGYFSIFKRGMKGVYQHCSTTHLQRYLDEFSFRYSNRAKLGIDDSTRTMLAIKGAEGRRLTYRRTRSQKAA